jgi:DNA replication protein DnaC
MLTHPTLDQLKALKLDGMADAFVELQNQAQAADLAHAEWLALLLDREAANRNTRRFQVRLRGAKLRHGQAAIEDVDYRTPRRLDRMLTLICQLNGSGQATTCIPISANNCARRDGSCGASAGPEPGRPM